MTDESSSGDGSVSPWSGEVPVPNAPVEFNWAADEESDGTSASWAGTSDGSPAVGDAGTGSVQDSSAIAGGGVDPGRNRNLVVAGIGAVVLLLLGWLAFGRGDGSTEIAADDSIPIATEVEDSLPATEESAPAESDSNGDDESDDDDGESTGESGSVAIDGAAPEWREDTIELPQLLLDSTVPFDVVALTSDGDYIEVEVPSGRVGLVEIGRGIDGRVVAGETSTLFVSYSSTRGGRLLRNGEPPLELSLPSNVDISQVGVDGDEFAGISYGNNGEMSLVRIKADGGVVTTSDDDDDLRNSWQRSFTPDGSTLVSDAGGVYVERDDGFERISTGFLISASKNHMLVRDCDEVMVCGYFTVAFDSGERVEAAISDNNVGRFGFDSAQVSPDGRWLRYVAYDNDSSDEVLIDLATGDRTVLDFANIGNDAGVWAPDSSGFFRRSLAPGLEFFDVESGESINFGEQFGRMVSFDIREAPGRAAPPLRAPTTSGLSLVALTESGDVAQIDVDSGAVITTDGPGLDSTAPVTIFPDAAGATIASDDDVPSIRFTSQDRVAVVIEDFGPAGRVWPGAVPGTVWQPGGNNNLNSLQFELVDARGTDLDARIEFDGVGLNGIVGSDGNGGIVIQPTLGGVFALRATGPPERITSGELLAINASVAYVRECDDALQCGVFAVDRAGGARTLALNTGFSRAGDIASRGVPSGQNISPDGTIAFVRDGDDPSRCLMIDTTASNGSWTGVPCVDLASPIAWTADSGYAVWLDQGRITVYDRSTRAVRALNTVELRAIAVVPATEPAS